jgi:molybdopterin synthase catalytic subunit
MNQHTPLIEVELTETLLPRPMPWPLCSDSETGALTEFYGIVRGTEDQSAIRALHYEAYPKMAEKLMHEKIILLTQNNPCRAFRVVHRLGRIPVGESAIYVGIWSSHRQSGFQLLEDFMNELKKDVPIWKVRVEA